MYELKLYDNWYEESARKVRNSEGKSVSRLSKIQVKELDKLVRLGKVAEVGLGYSKYKIDV